MRLFGNVFPVRWNWSSSKLEANSVYGQWNFKMFLSYLTIYLFLLVIRHARRFALPQLTQRELPDERIVSGKDEEPQGPLVVAIDILFTSGIWCIGCTTSALVERLESFVCFVNAVLKTDGDLQGLEIFINKLKQLTCFIIILCCVCLTLPQKNLLHISASIRTGGVPGNCWSLSCS